MNVYSINAYSDCGTYIQAYLKSVTVVAENDTAALAMCNEWLKETGHKFITKHVEIECLGKVKPGVLTCDIDRDHY